MKVLDRVGVFLFTGTAPETAALVRIGLALTLLFARLTFIPEFGFYFSDDGMLPNSYLTEQQPSHHWSVLHQAGSPGAAAMVHAVLILSLIFLAVGCSTRTACGIAFILLASFRTKNPMVANSGDDVAMVSMCWLFFADSGRCWSVDAWRRARKKLARRPWEGGWAVRMLQIQLCFIYGWSVVTKLYGESWRSGDAMFYVASWTWDWRQPQTWIMDSPWIYKTVTYGTMLVEFAYPLFVWVRRARPWLIALILGMHLCIAGMMGILYFSLYMIALQGAFVERRSWIRRAGSPRAGAR